MDNRLDFENGEAILSGGEEGSKIKARVRHKFGEMQSGRIGLGASKSIVKYKGFIIGGKGVKSLPVSPQDCIRTIWAVVKSKI